MFRILCLTNGQHIKITAQLMPELTVKMPANVREALPASLTTLRYKSWYEPTSWEYLEFDTEEAARWFVSHRLVYNPRRKDVSKLNFMRDLFELNDIPGWETIEIEFEVEQV